LIHPASININNCPGEHHDFDFMGAILPRMTIDNGATERPQSADRPKDTRRSSFGTLRVGEADEWRIRAAAWAEYHCISQKTNGN